MNFIFNKYFIKLNINNKNKHIIKKLLNEKLKK